MRLEPAPHPVLVLVRLELVVLEPVDDFRIVGGLDQTVEQAEDRLLERVCFVDVLHQLRVDIGHDPPPQLELAVGSAERGRAPAEPVPIRLEDVDEERKRGPVAELASADVEGNAGAADDERLAARTVDPLPDAGHRRQRPGETPYFPDSVELSHEVR